MPCCKTPRCSPILGECENIINCRDQNAAYQTTEHPRPGRPITELKVYFEHKAATIETTNLYECQGFYFGNVST